MSSWALFSCHPTAQQVTLSLSDWLTDWVSHLNLKNFDLNNFDLENFVDEKFSSTIVDKRFHPQLMSDFSKSCDLNLTLETLITCDTWDTDYIADNWEQHY